MDALSAGVTIERPPLEIYNYLIDIANYPEFCDHFLTQWHLTREETYGIGAGARFKIKGRDRFAFGEMTIVEAVSPLKIVSRGRGGRFNRIRTVFTWTLSPTASGSATNVQLEVENDATAPFDRFRNAMGGRRADRRRWRRALGRLEAILERDEGRGTRASISGGARKPATNSPLR